MNNWCSVHLDLLDGLNLVTVVVFDKWFWSSFQINSEPDLILNVVVIDRASCNENNLWKIRDRFETPECRSLYQCVEGIFAFNDIFSTGCYACYSCSIFLRIFSWGRGWGGGLYFSTMIAVWLHYASINVKVVSIIPLIFPIFSTSFAALFYNLYAVPLKPLSLSLSLSLFLSQSHFILLFVLSIVDKQATNHRTVGGLDVFLFLTVHYHPPCCLCL